MAIRPGGRGGVPKFWAPSQVTADAVYYLTCDAGDYRLTGDDETVLGPPYRVTGFDAPLKLTLTAEATAAGDGAFQSDAFQSDAFQGGAGAGYVLTGADAALTVAAGGTTLSALSGTYVLTGSSAALFKGLVASSSTYTLTGASAGLKLGFVPAAGSYVLSGSSAALLRGHVAGAGAYVLTGLSAALLRGQVVGAGSYILSGAVVPLRFTLTADGRTSTSLYDFQSDAFQNDAFQSSVGAGYVLTGATATFVTGAVATTLSADAGSYTLTGASVTFIGVAGFGYTLTGFPARLNADVTQSAGSGSYTITGTNVHLVGVAPGYALTGSDARVFQPGYFVRGYSVHFVEGLPHILSAEPLAAGIGSGGLLLLVASGGSAGYNISGRPAAFGYSAGSYILGGSDAALARDQVADAGVYALSGADITFSVIFTSPLNAEAGAYTLSGSDAILPPPPAPEIEPPRPAPSPGGSGFVVPRYKKLKLKKKRKKEELEELLEFVRNLPPPASMTADAGAPSVPSSGISSLLDGMAAPTVPQIQAAIDEEEDEIALLLEVL